MPQDQTVSTKKKEHKECQITQKTPQFCGKAPDLDMPPTGVHVLPAGLKGFFADGEGEFLLHKGSLLMIDVSIIIDFNLGCQREVAKFAIFAGMCYNSSKGV